MIADLKHSQTDHHSILAINSLSLSSSTLQHLSAVQVAKLNLS